MRGLLYFLAAADAIIVASQFDAFDLNGDGELSRAELGRAVGEELPPVMSSIFVGRYVDPKHPGCPRTINTSAIGLAVRGADEDGVSWILAARAKQSTIAVDFSPKGGPGALTGNWTGNGIAWADGNFWNLSAASGPTACKHPTAVQLSPASELVVPAASSGIETSASSAVAAAVPVPATAVQVPQLLSPLSPQVARFGACQRRQTWTPAVALVVVARELLQKDPSVQVLI